MECIGKGKAHRPYEFGVKVSVATPLQRCRGGQFVVHVAALPGNLYDGHTLAKMIPAITRQIGTSLTTVIADAGYRGQKAPHTKGLRVYTSGQKRGVTDQIKRELRRRAAVEPVIGHLKEEHRMGRNYLAGQGGRLAAGSGASKSVGTGARGPSRAGGAGDDDFRPAGSGLDETPELDLGGVDFNGRHHGRWPPRRTPWPDLTPGGPGLSGGRDGLIARLSCIEAAELLAAQGLMAHPLDLALCDAERLGSASSH